MTRDQVGVAAELAPEFDQLRADVAAWCAAMLPCLTDGCSHPLGGHGPGGGACRRCGCWAYTGRHGQRLDQVTVTVGRRSADESADRPTTDQGSPRD